MARAAPNRRQTRHVPIAVALTPCASAHSAGTELRTSPGGAPIVITSGRRQRAGENPARRDPSAQNRTNSWPWMSLVSAISLYPAQHIR